MKIRLDFVTNSSSSSFVSFTIDNKVLYNLVRKCRIKGMSTARETIQCSTFNINDRPVLPFERKTSLADWLVDFFNKLELTSMDMTSEARDELVKEIKSKKEALPIFIGWDAISISLIEIILCYIFIIIFKL